MNIQLHLFSNLNLLLSSLGVSELEEMYKDFTKTSDDICVAIRKIDPKADLSDFYSTSWRFNAAKRERVTSSIINGELFQRKEKFDDWVLDSIKREKNKIVCQLNEIFYDCQTDFELKQKAIFFIGEINSLKESLVYFSFPYLSKKFVPKVLEILNEIETFLKGKIKDKTSVQISIGGKVQTKLKSFIAEKKPAKLRHLYEKLKEAGFIQDPDDKSYQFKGIFSGAPIPNPDDRIIWKNQRALKFFILSLENVTFSIPGSKGKNAFSIPADKWVMVNQYFVKPNCKEFNTIGNDTAKLSTVTAGIITAILNDLCL